jgi:hypothetical protein
VTKGEDFSSPFYFACLLFHGMMIRCHPVHLFWSVTVIYVIIYLVLLAVVLLFNAGAAKLNEDWDS